jgi:hypothetical protein
MPIPYFSSGNENTQVILITLFAGSNDFLTMALKGDI